MMPRTDFSASPINSQLALIAAFGATGGSRNFFQSEVFETKRAEREIKTGSHKVAAAAVTKTSSRNCFLSPKPRL